MRTACLLIVVLGGAALAAPAHAQDAAAAESLFREGRALMEREQYEDACEKFALSQRLDPALGTLLNLALCHERLGNLATAWAGFTEAAELAARRNDERARVAKERAAALAPRVPRLAIELEGTPPPGLKVTRNGQDVTELLGEDVPVDPGTYEIEATAPDRAPWNDRVEIAEEGATATVTVPELEERSEHGEPAVMGLDERPAPPAREHGGGRRLAGMITGGAGVVAAATGLGFGLHARSKWNASREYCDSDNVCSDDRGIALTDSAGTSADVATILVGAGVAATATGIVLWATAPSRSSGPKGSQHSSATRLVPLAYPERIGVSLEGNF